jgi:hypothetical protein
MTASGLPVKEYDACFMQAAEFVGCLPRKNGSNLRERHRIQTRSWIFVLLWLSIIAVDGYL